MVSIGEYVPNIHPPCRTLPCRVIWGSLPCLVIRNHHSRGLIPFVRGLSFVWGVFPWGVPPFRVIWGFLPFVWGVFPWGVPPFRVIWGFLPFVWGVFPFRFEFDFLIHLEWIGYMHH